MYLLGSLESFTLPESTDKKGIVCGLTCDTMNVFILKSSESFYIGKSLPTDPSWNRKPVDLGLYGTAFPLGVSIQISTAS